MRYWGMISKNIPIWSPFLVARIKLKATVNDQIFLKNPHIFVSQCSLCALQIPLHTVRTSLLQAFYFLAIKQDGMMIRYDWHLLNTGRLVFVSHSSPTVTCKLVYWSSFSSFIFTHLLPITLKHFSNWGRWSEI